ncbi:MAG TPA: SoxY-related AACIE arm protein [Beijerinckiaceae bacterium]
MKGIRQQGGSTRRQILAAGGGLASALVVRPAVATPAEMDAAIRAFAGEADIRSGKVKLEVPLLVENGNSVALTVTVDSPMTANEFVKTIAVFNEKNPQPNVVNFHLGPRAGRASVSTRIRVADSQKLVAVAELSDGTFWSASAEVIVTLPACAEDS